MQVTGDFQKGSAKAPPLINGLVSQRGQNSPRDGPENAVSEGAAG